MLLESAGMPLPGETITLMGGYLGGSEVIIGDGLDIGSVEGRAGPCCCGWGICCTSSPNRLRATGCVRIFN